MLQDVMFVSYTSVFLFGGETVKAPRLLDTLTALQFVDHRSIVRNLCRGPDNRGVR